MIVHKSHLVELRISFGILTTAALLYVCKKKAGKEYAQSTNTDLYYNDIASG